MNQLIFDLKQHVISLAENPSFIHHQWFVKHHLEIVEKISLELCDIYKDADRDAVLTLVWLHDYGKTIDFDNQYEVTLHQGKEKLLEIGFEDEFVNKLVDYAAILDIKENLDRAPIEVQIVSSADAASHYVGPFYYMWFHENSKRSMEELLEGNIKKDKKDWEKKMVLPEVKKAFEKRRELFMELQGRYPERFLD